MKQLLENILNVATQFYLQFANSDPLPRRLEREVLDHHFKLCMTLAILILHTPYSSQWEIGEWSEANNIWCVSILQSLASDQVWGLIYE